MKKRGKNFDCRDYIKRCTAHYGRLNKWVSSFFLLLCHCDRNTETQSRINQHDKPENGEAYKHVKDGCGGKWGKADKFAT